MGLKRTDEFRADAVRIALTSGLTRKQVASDLGVGLSTLNKWITAHRDTDVMSDKDLDLARENERLRRENRILKEEREILKNRSGPQPAQDQPHRQLVAEPRHDRFHCRREPPAPGAHRVGEVDELLHQKSGGVGLENLKRRLNLIYPSNHHLKIVDGIENYSAVLNINLS